MKKYFLSFLSFLLSIACSEKPKFHPDKAYVEDFVSQAVEEVIFKNNDWRYFNLMPYSFYYKPYFNNNGIGSQELKKYLKIHEFEEKDFFDTIQIEWKDYKIDSSHLLTLETIPIPPYLKDSIRYIPFTTDTLKIDELNQSYNRDFFVPFKKSWSQQEVQDVTKKWKKRYEDSFNEEDYYLHYISRPVFSRDGKYAIVVISRSVSGAVYGFRVENNKWIIDAELRRWIH